MSFSFTVQELAQLDLLRNLVEDQGLQERCLALAKRARCESGEIAPSSTQCGAIGDSSFSAAGALDGEELLPIELLECGTTPAGALDHEELLDVELLECGTTPAGGSREPKLLRVSSKSAGYDCVINVLVPQGRLRHQRPRSAGSTA